MTKIRVGVAQVRQTAHIDLNFGKIMEYLDRAGEEGVDILCFPEAQLPGYRVDISPFDAPVQEERLDRYTEMISQRCCQLNIACILGTETPIAGGKPLNSAVIIDERGKQVGRHSKTILTPLDAKAYSPGQGFGVWPLKGVPCGVVICFEGFRFAHTTRACVSQGAQIIFHPQNNTTRPGLEWKTPVHEAMAVTRAAENTIFFVSANICIEYQNCPSLIIGPEGTIRAVSQLKREELLVADIDPDEATRAMFHFQRDGMGEVLFGQAVSREEYNEISSEEMRREEEKEG